MACPFFMPTDPLQEPLWPHPSRLPLGCGWNGYCTAPAAERSSADQPNLISRHQSPTLDELPTQDELKDGCNLGYASRCSRLPQERHADAVRIGILRDTGAMITLQFVLELAHRPGAHGVLEYQSIANTWTRRHPDQRIQRMAECYLESYLQTRR